MRMAFPAVGRVKSIGQLKPWLKRRFGLETGLRSNIRNAEQFQSTQGASFHFGCRQLFFGRAIYITKLAALSALLTSQMKKKPMHMQFLRVWLGQITMTKEQSKTIQDMRHEGYAVVVWNSEELRGVDPIRVEDRMIEKGGDYIDQISPVEEEVGVE